MNDCEDIKERVYYAMPAEQISIDVLAYRVNIQRNKLAFILRMLRFDGRVEYLGRHYSRQVSGMRAFWRRK